MSDADSSGPGHSPRKRFWLAAGVVVVAGVGAALYFADVAPTRNQAAGRARQQLLQLGSALKRYATAHDHALPDQVPAEAALAASSVMYRAVTPSGERLKYESFGERVVAWTEPDASGRRLVLLNSLDEAEFVPVAQLDLSEQRRLDAGSGALNRVRKVSIAEDDEEGSDDGAAEPTSAESSTQPATSPATQSAR